MKVLKLLEVVDIIKKHSTEMFEKKCGKNSFQFDSSYNLYLEMKQWGN